MMLAFKVSFLVLLLAVINITSANSDVTGPNLGEKIDLINETGNINGMEADFKKRIRWSHELIKDKTSPKVHYYFPREYLIKRSLDNKKGFEANIFFRYASAGKTDDAVIFSFTLGIPKQIEDTKLLKTIAQSANHSIELKPLPIDSVKIILDSLDVFINSDNIKILNRPTNVLDDLSIEVITNGKTLEEIYSRLIDGLGGVVELYIGDESIEIPLSISISNFSGKWLNDPAGLNPKNLSPWPVKIKGVVAYTVNKTGGSLKRHSINLKSDMIIPNGKKHFSKKLKDILPKNRKILAAWYVFDVKSNCKLCLKKIRQQIVSTAGQVQHDAIEMQANPRVFEQLNLYNIIVEIRSHYFYRSESQIQTRKFDLKVEKHNASVKLYMPSELKHVHRTYEFRFKPVRADGQQGVFSKWQKTNDLDIILGSFQLNPLLAD